MKKSFLFLTMIISIIGGSAQTYTVPVVDLEKEYPTKEIELSEIADVRYVPLETTEYSLIKGYSSIAMDGKRIVITDNPQNQVFIFDNNGKFLNKIAKQGGGPEDYQSISHSAVDFKNNLIYIWDYYLLNRIKVYDFDGKFIKQINVGNIPWPDQLYVYDDKHLIIYSSPLDESSSSSRANPGKYPYRLIDIETGKSKPLNIKVENPMTNKVGQYNDDGTYSLNMLYIYPMMKADNKVIISDYATPYVYEAKDGKLFPIMKRLGADTHENGVNNLSSVDGVSDRYLFISQSPVKVNKNAKKLEVQDGRYLMYDNVTKKIHDIEIKNNDYSGHVQFFSWSNDLPKNTAVKNLPIFLLDKRHDEKKLSPKMEKIYSSLPEESNDILEIIYFK